MNLPVLALLAEHWPEVRMHLSEVIKESESQAMPFCEFAFVAPNSLVEQLLLKSNLTFNWNLQFCGWLFDKRKHPELALEFKRSANGRLAIPEGVELAFSSSDDWDCFQFFSRKTKLLEEIQSRLQEA